LFFRLLKKVAVTFFLPARVEQVGQQLVARRDHAAGRAETCGRDDHVDEFF
jgi:hypothetical protein